MRQIGAEFESFEHLAEDPVELVEIALVLDQAGAGEKVEILDRFFRQIRSHASQRVRYSRSETGICASRREVKKLSSMNPVCHAP